MNLDVFPVFSHPTSLASDQTLPLRAATTDEHRDTVLIGGVMATELIGNLLDSLGVEVNMDDGDMVASAVVLLKVIDTNGDVSLRTLSSDGLSWIERLGMFRAAESVELPRIFEDAGE